MRSILTAMCTLTVALLAGCGSHTEPASSATAQTAAPAPAADVPGAVVEVKPYADIDPSIRDLGAEALRVRYRSTSSDGQHTVVTGALFIPAGTPPPGGWPVLSHAHGTTGWTNDCGPSGSPNLYGMVVMVGGYLKAGYAVAFTDYQGLGGGGKHVYLDNKTEGYNVIDAVRALRNAKPGAVSDRWVAVGGSQGGGASWSAAEQAPVYAPELRLLGAVNIVPAANVSGYAQMAEDEAMTPEQSAAYVAVLITQAWVHPDFDVEQYRRGSVKTNWDVLGSCKDPAGRTAAVLQLKPDELKPATHEAMLKLQANLQALAVPQRKTDVPMLVIYAGQDEYIDPASTKQAIEDACKLGTKIDVDFQADKSHGTVDASHVLDWLRDRLEEKPLPKSC
ncbi:MAG: lipase family protein [Rudaea sp.]|uniref:lipase family protein n=1 Tax=Rudaea sp. TaxID=2136325 RepID=UPI0039E22E1E